MRISEIADGPAEISREAGLRRRTYKRRAFAIATAVALIAIAACGYLLGISTGVDVDAAYDRGVAEGARSGEAAGTRTGYDNAFRAARKSAYEAAYSASFTEAYRAQFDGLPEPGRIPVSRPVRAP